MRLWYRRESVYCLEKRNVSKCGGVKKMIELMKVLDIDLDKPVGWVKVAVASLILGFVGAMVRDFI